MARRAFIIGGTGQIGGAIADDFLAHGWEVVASHRGRRPLSEQLVARGAKPALLDREGPGGLKRALACGADAVIDTIAYTAAHADQLLEIEGDVGAFVVISSSSVYRDEIGRSLDEAAKGGFPDFPEPIQESQLTVEPGPETYSTNKVALERRLLDRARRPVTILRPCAIHGPHSLHPRAWWFVKRMRDRRMAIPLAYRGESRFHTSAAVNIAALARVALEQPDARILNAADPSVLTVAEIGATIAGFFDYRGTFLPVDSDAFPAATGATPWSIPAPFTLNIDAAVALGYRAAATYQQAVAATCGWLAGEPLVGWREKFPTLASYAYQHFDYAAEDAFLASRPSRNLPASAGI